MLEDSGFVDVQIGPAVDTFKGASGEDKARKFAVYGYPFMARKPVTQREEAVARTLPVPN